MLIEAAFGVGVAALMADIEPVVVANQKVLAAAAAVAIVEEVVEGSGGTVVVEAAEDVDDRLLPALPGALRVPIFL